MKQILSVVFVTMIGAIAAVAVAAGSDAFVDRFQRLDLGRWFVSDGWSNGNTWLNDWRKSQISVGPSGLTVTLDKNPASKNGYSSGEIQTREKFRYGYFEARMRAAPGSGMDTGIFTYIVPTGGRPSNEIDVEILGNNTRKAHLTYHTGKDQRGAAVDLPFDAAAGSHVFGFDWQPQYIRWYADGKLVHEETGAQLALPSAPQQLFFDLWNSNSSGSWMGLFTWPGHPITAQLSCVAVAPHYTGAPIC